MGFYITTAIDYPSGRPHMGHAYEKIVADAYARWKRLMGEDVYYLTGTDENGQKLVRSARSADKKTQDFVNEQADRFRHLCQLLNISHDDFIRTTESRHQKVCQELWRELEDKGYIYFDHYSGQYCYECESFYTQLQAPEGQCPHHFNELQHVDEEGYFFRLSDFQEWILNYLKEHPDFLIPDHARQEMIARIEAEPVRDLSISRKNEDNWGVPVPSNPNHVMYTWFDALINYYSAIQDESLQKYWPATVHVIGKDINWFHSVIWPAMLRAAEIPLPRQIYVHGMVLGEDGRKMSKTLGNTVDPFEVLEWAPLDSFRYYLLRAIPSDGDGRFSRDELVAKHNGELANDFGNLVTRVIKLTLKKYGAELTGQGIQPDVNFGPLIEKTQKLMNSREHHRALEEIWNWIRSANAYLNEQAPWRLEKDDPILPSVLYNSLHAILVFSLLAEPFLPEAAQKARSYLGTKIERVDELEFGAAHFYLSKPAALFPKLEHE